MVLSGEWWNQSSRPILKKQGAVASGDVETDDLAASSVTSEKAGNPLKTRSVVVALPDPAKGAKYATTCHGVWKPLERAEIRRVQLTPLTAWSAVTCGVNVQIYSTNGAVGIVTATSTAFGPAGVALDLALTNTCLGACELLQIGAAAVNACDDIPAMAVQIDYVTSG